METWGWPTSVSYPVKFDAEDILACDEIDPRMKLAEFLGWDKEKIDEEKYLKNSIELDYLYDALLFCMGKGFAQNSVCRLLQFATSIYIETQNQTLVDAVKHYKLIAETEFDDVPQMDMKTFTEYIFNTFFHHWRIYEIIRSTERNVSCQDTELILTVPPLTLPFNQAKEIRIFEYEKAVHSIEQDGEEQKNKYNEDMKKEQEEKRKLLKKTYSQLDECKQPLQRKELENLIMEVASVQLNAVSLNLTQKVNITMQDLSTMVKKSAVPRPSELGSPEKYPTKSAKVTEQKAAGRAASRTTSAVSSRTSRHSVKKK